MATRAIAFLTEKKIPFEVRMYDHGEKGALFAAAALDLPAEQVVKTLVVELDRKHYLLALMPGTKEVNLKSLARFCGRKRGVMTDTKTAERLTGYKVGGISPFGTKRRFQVVMDRELLQHERVAVNGGGRGIMLVLSPTDLLEVVAGQVEDLGR